jgi:hypothetical protein
MNENVNNSLLSGLYFIKYKNVLKIVLPVVAVSVLFVNILSIILNKSDQFYSLTFWGIASSQTIGISFAFTLLAFGIVTFVFAIFERYKVNIITKQKYFLESSYNKVVKNIGILAGSILIIGIVISLIFYYNVNENIASMVFVIISAISFSLYVALTIILIKHLKKKNIE